MHGSTEGNVRVYIRPNLIPFSYYNHDQVTCYMQVGILLTFSVQRKYNSQKVAQVKDEDEEHRGSSA